MSNLFLNYLNQRFHRDKQSADKTLHTPDRDQIITISRQAGCSAKELAELFYKSINKNIGKDEDKWRCIDKDIMMDSAKKLDLPVRKIKYVYNAQKKSKMDQIIESLSSRYYKSDRVIRKTIAEVMQDYAKKGNIIVVGRAGVALSKYVSRSFNIRLVAPLQWRIDQISQKHEITKEDAHQYITEIDFKRTALIEEFYGKKMEESMFDIIFNCQTISKEEIVHISIELMKVRGFF